MKYLAIVLILILVGCKPQEFVHTDSRQSWDQENLKKSDSGCPTAIFIAPNGVLKQCP